MKKSGPKKLSRLPINGRTDFMAKIKYPSLSSYPTVFGIVYANRNDTLPDKRIAAALAEKNEVKALKIALGTTASRHRMIVLALYYCRMQLDWVPPLWLTLSICRLIGPSSSWFSYLLKSDTRPSLLTAATLLASEKKKRQRIFDVGCGLGHLPQQFPYRTGCEWICVDKNFFNLFLAKLYHHRRDVTYICADAEVQELFPHRFFSAVVLVESFPWISQKDIFIQKAARLLEKGGLFIMTNVHENLIGTALWGYGIDHLPLKKVVMKFFKTLQWHDHREPSSSLRTSFKDLDPHMYSFLAQK